MIDNIGTLNKLSEFVTLLEISKEDNWVTGRLKNSNLYFQAKIFANPSVHGINNGRISKLVVYEGPEWTYDWDKVIINYDRGWDIKPTTQQAKEILNKFLSIG